MGDVWLESRASKSKMSESLDTQAKRKCPATAPEEEARAGHPVMGLDVCVGGGRGGGEAQSLCLSLSLSVSGTSMGASQEDKAVRSGSRNF